MVASFEYVFDKFNGWDSRKLSNSKNIIPETRI